MRLTGAKNCCPTCGAYFRNTRAFDDHRIGDHGVSRRCLTDLEMLLVGMTTDRDGFWRDVSNAKKTTPKPEGTGFGRSIDTDLMAFVSPEKLEKKCCLLLT